MRQETLYKEMLEGGIARYRGKVQSAKEREAETDAPYGGRLLRGSIPRLVEDVKASITFHKKNRASVPAWMPNIWDEDIGALCVIALKSVLDSISIRKTLLKSSIAISNFIQDEVRYNWFKTNHPEIFKHAEKDVKRSKGAGHGYRRNWYAYMRHEEGEVKQGNIKGWRNWDRKTKAEMGTWFLEAIRKSTHLIRFIRLNEGVKTKYFISPTDELFEWINEYNESKEWLSPMWMPMVTRPFDWTGIWSGGYTAHNFHSTASERLPAQSLVKTYDMEHLRSLNVDKMPVVLEGMNHIQSTGFKVNQKVLSVMQDFWRESLLVGEMPQREDYPIPAFPDSDDPERKKEWKRQAARIHDRNLSLKSQRLQVVKTMGLAEKFKEESEIFFPCQLDFRGRVYPIPHFLSPQGTDIGKSLLLFSKGETIWDTIADTRWLAIHGANCWGNDKVTLDERVQWVRENRVDIQNVYKDPYAYTWWTEADEPWQFLAFCFEWGEMLTQGGKGFVTHLPCAMDASNNGIQILSMLARDPVGAKATNVLPTESPADLYGYVAERVRQKLKKLGDPLSMAWLDFGIDRKTCKRPVMVKPYGGTRFSCRAYIDEWYNDKVVKENVADPFVGERFKACQHLASVVWNAMGEILIEPDKVMRWLQDNIKTLNGNDTHAVWVSPSGLTVKQHYRGGVRHWIRTVLTESSVQLALRADSPTLDRVRQTSGVAPNFVHSLDASAVHMTASLAKKFGIDSISMVHDSYATHSTKCQKLADTLRFVFSKIFDDDLLTLFQEDLQNLTDEDLPSPLKLGELQCEEVLNSDYFFA